MAEDAGKTGSVDIPDGASVVRLPKLGKQMEEGSILVCRVEVGDKVIRGDVLFEIETDKTTLEMESPGDGVVKAVLVPLEKAVPIHTPLMILADEAVEIPQEVINSLKATQPCKPTKTSSKSAESIEEAMLIPQGGEVQYELGQTVPMNRYQKTIAQRMLQSKREIPCFYLTIQIDMTGLIEFRKQFNRDNGTDAAYNDFLIRAVAMGLERFNVMTGQTDGDVIKLADSIGIGLAIVVPGGLVAPIVRDANNKTVKQISEETKSLIEKAGAGKFSPDDLTGGCITISNLGSQGIESFIPIVVPGQCSILGIGRIVDTPVPDRGTVLERKTMKATLSVDHRVANGSYAAQFLDFVRQLLQDPVRL